MFKKTTVLSLLLLLGFARVLVAQETPAVPVLTTRVYDETATLTPEQKQSLEGKLAFYEDSTSTQIVIVIMKTLNGYPVSDFATEIGNKNKLGQTKKNNGVVILLSKDERQGFIATGYGVEPTVTDALAGIIFRDVIRPSLRQNDYYGGLSRAADAVISATKGEFKGDPKAKAKKRPDGIGVGAFVFVIIIFVVIVILRAAFGSGVRRTVVGAGGTTSGFMGGLLQALFWATLFSGRNDRGGGGFGGGGFGGGGGGFSGGGGSFGGGGAGGSW